MVSLFDILVETVRIISNTPYAEYFTLKGGVALMTKVSKQKKFNLIRQTKDIDIHCTNKEIWLKFTQDVENILNANTLGICYKLIKHRGLGKTGFSDSLIFQVSYSNSQVKIGIDMNIKSQDFSNVFIPELNIKCYDNYVMLADKISVLYSKNIYRRIKDMYDVCILSQLQDYDMQKVVNTIKSKNTRKLELYMQSENITDLWHAYDKLTRISSEYNFERAYTECCAFTFPIFRSYLEGGQNWLWVAEKKHWFPLR